MDAPARHDAYVPPAAEVPAPPSTPPAVYGRIARYALVVNPIASAVAGAASAIQFAYGLSRFGGVEYVPRVVVLTALREQGGAEAFAWTCFVGVILVHRASRSEVPRAPLERRGAWRIGAAIALLHPICVAALVAAGAVALRLFYGVPLATFAAELTGAIVPGDVVVGALKSLVDAAIAVLLLPVALRWVAASRRGLVPKLVLAWLAVQLCLVVVSAPIALLERALLPAKT